MNYQKISWLILRLGLAATFVYSGLDLILHPTGWLAFVPSWFANFLPVETITYLRFQGSLELLLALGFIFGWYLRQVSFIAAFEMILILVLYGFDGVTFRDLAILGGSLAVFFSTFTPPTQPDAAPILTTAPQTNLSQQQKRFRTILVVSAFVLFSIILIGLFWLSNTTRDQAGWLAFSYATGLSMIVLPCTLPLAFVIVPLAMGKDPKKGMAIAIAFAVGVTITLSIYGAIIAKLGQVVGLDRAKDIMYTIAGVFAVVFGLGELGLIKLRVPTYGGAFPKFIQERKDVGKGFLLGLLLGNVGLGCPNPAFYVLLSYIATVGSIGTGWFLTFIHAVGRVTPLLLLAILAVLGVDALSVLIKRKDAIARVTAWGVVAVGAFILTFGLLGHDWYVYSGIHSLLELVTQEAAFVTQYAEQFGGLAHAHEVPSGPYIKYGSWLMVTLIVIPLIWTWRRKYKDLKPEDSEKRQGLKWMGAYVISFALFLYLLFGITLPNWYRYEVVPMMHGEEMMDETTEEGHMDNGEHVDEDMDGMMHEEDLEIKMNVKPENPSPSRPATLEFQIIEPSTGKIITNLDITHGQPMHLIGVRKEDVSKFFHIHPILKQNTYTVNHIFAEPGTYVFWPEIVYQGHEVIKRFELVVGDPPIISYLPSFERTLRLEDDLVVQLKGPVEFEVGKKTLFGFSVTDSGGFDLPLGKYLEENSHVTILFEDLLYYYHLHVNYGEIGEIHDTGHKDSYEPSQFFPVAFADAGHPHPEDEAEEVIDQSAFGPKDLLLRFNFSHAGLHKIFVEFVLAENPDKVIRAEYWIEAVEPVAPAALPRQAPSKILLTIISLILIAAILPLIHRFLKEENIKV